MTEKKARLRLVNSVAPIRICDNGGWTDTWFAGWGKVLNIGVYPYVEVQIEVFQRTTQEKRIELFVENFGDQYILQNEKKGWGKHPLLEAAIEFMDIPDDISLKISIHSEASAGGSTGTSAAVSVALIGALDCLSHGKMTQHEVAFAAHKVESELLHQQSGIQDQIASAYGGINYIDMYQYPHASISQLYLPDSTWWELERRLLLIFLGASHSSSEVHEMVISELEDTGPDCPKLNHLRNTPEMARDALYSADFRKLGLSMRMNTDAQIELNSALVAEEARQIIEISKDYGALGWKVNGAGGSGGSITLLCSDISSEKRELIRQIELSNSGFKNVPIRLSRSGLRTWIVD